MTQTRWKFINKGFKSNSGNYKWTIGEWSPSIKKLDMCRQGYHCSKGIYQAFSYVQGEILAQVECKGKHDIGDNKEVWETMRIIKAYKWTKKDSVALSIYAAELCIDNFERVYPNDKRPREAIEAAKKFLKYPTVANRSAAESAESVARSASESAWSADSAIRSATWSAWSAADSAGAATESAAESARAAVLSAESAIRSARAAAWSALIKNIADWMDNRLLVLKEIKKNENLI